MAEKRFEQQRVLFDKFKEGEEDALLLLLEAERVFLYDYLLLMTGHDERSQATLEEVSQVISADADRFNDARSLIGKLYVTARNFCGDIWNADVHQLENKSLLNQDDEVAELRNELQKLDLALKKLPGPDREIICLSLRSGFASNELASMFKVDADLVDMRIRKTLNESATALGLSEDNVANLLKQVPRHVPHMREAQSTLALSEVMGKLEESKKGYVAWRKYLFLLVFIGGMCALVYFMGWHSIFLKLLK